MATLGILGSHLAGDFFLGIDILVTSMLVNFGLICLSLVTLPRRNPALAREVKVLGRTAQRLVGGGGAVILGLFLVLHIVKDLSTEDRGVVLPLHLGVGAGDGSRLADLPARDGAAPAGPGWTPSGSSGNCRPSEPAGGTCPARPGA